MSAPPFMPLYVGDYLGDTTHLSTFEHGCYLLLLMTMWRAGGRLPNDPVMLAKYVRASVNHWRKASVVVLDFFTVDGDEITHGRLLDELSHYDDIVKVRTTASHAGVRAKRLKNNKPVQPIGKPNGQPNDNPTRTTDKEQITPTELSGSLSARPTPSPADGQASAAPFDLEAWTSAQAALLEKPTEGKPQ